VILQRPALIPYLTAGWPSPPAFLEAVAAAARAGCPLFEVGFPFSDPVADGPVIQRTSHQALQAGMTVGRCLELTRQATQQTGLPAVVMTYVNLVYHHGPQDFCRQAAAAGARGLIVADLPIEEGEPFERAAAQAGLDLVYLCAPTTPAPRRALIARRSRGFVYLVSVSGTTGEKDRLPEDLEPLIAELRQVSPWPVCVGFGISTPQMAARVARVADGVIVGSALLRRLEGRADVGAAVEEFLGSLQAAIRADPNKL
jgi:tryptophan synthase alpha chain